MSEVIKQPTLYIRQAYFVDSLLETTGLGFAKIERCIRKNQFERFGLRPPTTQSVRNYFSLKRYAGIDPRQDSPRTPPWLIAAEQEFPGSTYSYFHPLFDLLWGSIESSLFWEFKFGRIPDEWIDEYEKSDKDYKKAQAAEWREWNALRKARSHHKKNKSKLDHLTFIQLSLLRLPVVSQLLFEKSENSSEWVRKYDPADQEICSVAALRSFDGLAGLIGLLMESSAIGDIKRFHLAKKTLQENLPMLETLPGCGRICERLTGHINNHIQQEMPRSYSKLLHHGFGLPMTWRLNFMPPEADPAYKCAD